MKREPIRKRHDGITARKLAEKHGVSVRTIVNYVAEKRSDYEQRALDRRKQVFDLRFHQRQSFDEIAFMVGTTKGGAMRMFQQARREFVH